MLYHYYGSTAYSWRVGDSVEEVLKALAKDAGVRSIKLNVENNGGLPAYTCKVHASRSASYDIRSFMPSGVECSEYVDFKILNVFGKHIQTGEGQ